MNGKPSNPRTPDWDVDSMFVDRWSPRGFSGEPLTEREIHTLFEAARWAPSCYNEQPWRFVYATEPQARARLTACLVAKNRAWAGGAPLLMFLLARRHFQKTGAENRHAPYDAGAAWMALALQARKLGLYAHAMAGFNPDKAYEALGVSREDYPGHDRYRGRPPRRRLRPAGGPSSPGIPERPQAPRRGRNPPGPRARRHRLRGGPRDRLFRPRPEERPGHRLPA